MVGVLVCARRDSSSRVVPLPARPGDGGTAGVAALAQSAERFTRNE